jgi:curved DNA-binding protein CbpA
MDYYVVLGIAEDADEDTIRRAFRALARRYHPDVGAGSSAVEFQRAREAYETLVDPERRRRYDRQLRTSRPRRVVIRQVHEVVVSRPSVEPLRATPRGASRFSRPMVTGTRSVSVDETVLELFASLDNDWFWLRPRR